MKCERISMALVKFLAALAALTIFGTAALYAEFNAGSYFEERTGSIHQSLAPVSTAGATYDAGAYPLYPISLPADTGQ